MYSQLHASGPSRPALQAESVPGLSSSVRGSATPRPVPVPRGGRKRVLVVEDEQDIADLIRHTLERGGDIEVELVASGDAALKSCTEQPPDLVLLDLNIPVLSGLEVCRILRQRTATATTPIIMRDGQCQRGRARHRPRHRRRRLRHQALQPARAGRPGPSGTAPRTARDGRTRTGASIRGSTCRPTSTRCRSRWTARR